MKKNLFLFAAAIALLFTFSGCSKESKKTTGRVVFWQTSSNASEALDLGVTAYKFYLVGEYQGSRSSAEYWDVAPDCDNTQPFVFSMDMGGSNTKTISFVLKDQDNIEWLNDVITLQAGECVQYQIR